MKLSLLDARVKLVMLFLLSTASVAASRPAMLLAVLGLTIAIILAGGADLKRGFGAIRGMLGLICLLFVAQCIFNRRGAALLTIGPLAIITREGLRTAVLVTLRLFIILLSAVIVLTGESRDYLLALTQWRVPYEIAFMVLIALRFIPLLRQEAQDVLCAVQMRGTKLKNTGLRKKAAVYISVMLPIVTGALRRSEQLSIAMEARAFRALPGRTSMRRLTMRGGDWAYLTVFIIVLGGIVWLFL